MWLTLHYLPGGDFRPGQAGNLWRMRKGRTSAAARAFGRTANAGAGWIGPETAGARVSALIKPLRGPDSLRDFPLRPNTDFCAFVLFEAYSMSRAYSQDLRDRVLAMAASGSSARQAAARFGIGVATAIVWVRRERQTGNKSALPRGMSRGSKLDAHADYILSVAAETPDIALKELKALLSENCGISVGIGTFWNFFDQRSITFKKTQRTLPNKLAQMS